VTLTEQLLEPMSRRECRLAYNRAMVDVKHLYAMYKHRPLIWGSAYFQARDEAEAWAHRI